MKTKMMTAKYKVFADAEGYRFHFYCDISGALLYTTKAVYTGTPEEALELAWKAEGKEHFNTCRKCGKYVSDVMWNADVLECVDCAPWENLPNYCPQCGYKLTKREVLCPECKHKLRYEGGDWHVGQI